MIPAAGAWLLAKAFFGKLWALLQLVPKPVWYVLIAVAALAYARHTGVVAGKAEVQALWDVERATQKAEAEALRQRGLELRKKRVAQGRMILANLAKDKADALAARESTIADLRSGALRLRDHWTCPRVPAVEAGTGAGGRDEATDLRQAGAADLVRLADEADADIRACQAVIAADREQFSQ